MVCNLLQDIPMFCELSASLRGYNLHFVIGFIFTQLFASPPTFSFYITLFNMEIVCNFYCCVLLS